MNKFTRGKIAYQELNIKYKDRIQNYINAGKKVNVKVTWEEAKEMVRKIDKEEIWVNDIYQVNILRGKDCDHLVLAKGLRGLCVFHFSSIFVVYL